MSATKPFVLPRWRYGEPIWKSNRMQVQSGVDESLEEFEQDLKGNLSNLEPDEFRNLLPPRERANPEEKWRYESPGSAYRERQERSNGSEEVLRADAGTSF